jgi:transcriptional regulator with XRE-family HTH domain
MEDKTRAELRKIGDAIRSARGAAGISQERLAELAEIDRTYVGRIENGRQNVSWASLSRIARALRKKPSGLIADAGL